MYYKIELNYKQIMKNGRSEKWFETVKCSRFNDCCADTVSKIVGDKKKKIFLWLFFFIQQYNIDSPWLSTTTKTTPTVRHTDIGGKERERDRPKVKHTLQ